MDERVANPSLRKQGAVSGIKVGGGSPPPEESPLWTPLCWIIISQNLPFIGKVVEQVLTSQLQRVLDGVVYLDPFQSNFRPFFGTEAA